MPLVRQTVAPRLKAPADLRSGWNTYGWVLCTSDVTATYVLTGSTSESSITAAMPLIQVEWQSSDLPNFTPASAPILAHTAIVAFERSASQAAASHAVPKTGLSSKMPHPTKTSVSTHMNTHSATGLSTGAKAGISVGVAVAIIACAILGFFLLHRKKKRTGDVTRTASKRPYLDTKAELDNTTVHGQPNVAAELPNRDPQEVAGDSSRPPPVPYASKPRHSAMGRSELDGGFAGHEVGSAHERQDLLS